MTGGMAEDTIRSVQVWHLKERIYTTLSGGEQRWVSIARVLAAYGATAAANPPGGVAGARSFFLITLSVAKGLSGQ